MCTLWGLKYLLSGCLFAVSWPLQAAELSLPSSALIILILLSPPQYSNMLPSQDAFLRYPYIDGRLHLFLCLKATLSLRPLLTAPFKAATLLPSTCYIPSVSFSTTHCSLTAASLKMAPTVGTVNGTYIPRTEEGLRSLHLLRSSSWVN